MSTQEAADYLDVTTYTVLRLIKRGSIKAYKNFGSGPWVIDRQSVEVYKQRNEDKSPHDPTRE